MTDMADAIPYLTLRAEELAATLTAFAARRRSSGKIPTLLSRRRALDLARRARALVGALGLAEEDDVLTVAKELTDLEDISGGLFAGDPDTVRPPPSSSGTFLVERKKASTNRLLAVRG